MEQENDFKTCNVKDCLLGELPHDHPPKNEKTDFQNWLEDNVREGVRIIPFRPRKIQ